MSLDLSPYEPVSNTTAQAPAITNAFVAIQNFVNSLPAANIAGYPASGAKVLLGDGTWGSVPIANLAGYPADATKVLLGNGMWATSPTVADLAYVEFTSSVNCVATTEATANSIVSAGAVTFDGTPVWLEFWCPGVEIDTVNRGQFALYDGSSSIGLFGRTLASATGMSDYEQSDVVFRRRFTPSAGAHTYSIRGFTSGGTLIVTAGAGGVGAQFPGFVRITKAP